MSDQVQIELVRQFPAILAAAFGFASTILILRARNRIVKLEENTNSIKDELVRVTGEAEHAKGVIQGKAEREK